MIVIMFCVTYGGLAALCYAKEQDCYGVTGQVVCCC